MPRKKKKNPAKNYFKKSSLSFLILLFLTALFEMGYTLKEAPPTKLPSSDQPLEIYANELDDNLKNIYLDLIEKAQYSIHLIIYSLIDNQIIEALNKKSQQGLVVHIVCDAKASVGISRKLPHPKIIRRTGPGLTHQKILVIDEKQILLGSANLTHDSLKVHGNLVIGIENESLAQTLCSKIRSMDEEGNFTPLMHLETSIGSESIELWQLPDDPEAVKRMIDLIDSAKKTIKVAMFTWTRFDFTDSLIRAHQRGVKVEALIDRNASKGSSAKVSELLKKHGIPVKTNSGRGLLHYKFAYIDDEILVNGSANWTKAAFTVNDDYFLVVQPLSEEHKDKMKKLWETIWQKGSRGNSSQPPFFKE